jgi:hypothetical protein
MTTKTEMIAKLKSENPTLRVGDDEQGYTDLKPADYEAQIALWADARLVKEAEAAQDAADATAKAAILKRLGLTADEAELLLN